MCVGILQLRLDFAVALLEAGADVNYQQGGKTVLDALIGRTSEDLFSVGTLPAATTACLTLQCLEVRLSYFTRLTTVSTRPQGGECVALV
jgi:hypothetical protein